MAIKKDTKWFIDNAVKLHGDKYDYSLSEYEGWNKKIKVICKIHGIFEQKATNHLNRYGCDKCARDKKKLLIDDFIDKSIKTHNNKYDYSIVNYTNNYTKVKIICKEHGIFEQIPNNHINGRGCIKCSGNFKKTNSDFIKESIEIHGNKYDYSEVEYINNNTPIKIICKKHGIFYQSPASHLSQHGCPNCKRSKSEWKIEKILMEHNVKYETQVRFNDCRDKRPLPFDFYIPSINTCIEFDGIQHFKEIKFWGKEHYNDRVKKDNIKNIYCLENNIRLIRIKYDEDILEKLKIENII
jgi:hypothetical protein